MDKQLDRAGMVYPARALVRHPDVVRREAARTMSLLRTEAWFSINEERVLSVTSACAVVLSQPRCRPPGMEQPCKVKPPLTCQSGSTLAAPDQGKHPVPWPDALIAVAALHIPCPVKTRSNKRRRTCGGPPSSSWMVRTSSSQAMEIRDLTSGECR